MPTAPQHREELASQQLAHTLESCIAPPPTRRGKVREIYERGDEVLLVATDRISAFDVILGTIPFKGATLTEQAVFWLEQAREVGPTHLLERPEAQVMRVRRAVPFAFEFVVRGYLAGSLLREPAETRGEAWGLRLDPHQAPFTPFAAPLVTPTTKEAVGKHDLPSSLEALKAKGVATQKQLDEVRERALALFALGSRAARERGLILVDTKYEFGLVGDEIVLIDEVHTADSSRYWVASSYDERLAQGDPPEMLDKERLRRWLREERNFTGEGAPPALPDDVRIDLASFYWSLTETITGRDFAPDTGPVIDRVTAVARGFLQS
ncbi:MAG: phosphoribosylaminoimidazolesuccinocarboxamide synthase [Myxococcota bacterium]